MSARIDGDYGCSSTYSLAQGAQMSNMLSQAAGSEVTATIGASANATSLSSGSQQVAETQAANVQIDTGEAQLGIGAVNAALGALQMQKYFKHQSQAQDISAGGNAGSQFNKQCTNEDCSNATDSPDGVEAGQSGYLQGKNQVGSKIINSYALNGENAGVEFTAVGPKVVDPQDPQYAAYQDQLKLRQQEESIHKNNTNNQMQQIGNQASGEQKTASDMAMMGGMMSMLTGGEQLMNGAMSIKAGEALKAAAAKLGSGSNPTLTPFAAPTLGGDISGGQSFVAPGALSEDGSTLGASTAATPNPTDAPPSLGPGFDPNPLPSGIIAPLTPGKFDPGNPQGGGGGGGGLDAGGSTGAGEKTQEDPQAKMAPGSQGTSYAAGSGAFSGGGGNKGKGAEGGPDLSALLEKFLPKKEDENKKPTSIIDFGNQGGDSTPYSLLGPEANIFQRVSETYQNRQSRGTI
jgi:hypothetical protein